MMRCGGTGTNDLKEVYEKEATSQKVTKFGCFTTPPRDEDDDSEDSEGQDEDGRAAPRTVWAWGGSFAVYQSQKRPGNHELLEILKREADEDLDFPAFLIRYWYAVHEVTPSANSWIPNS